MSSGVMGVVMPPLPPDHHPTEPPSQFSDSGSPVARPTHRRNSHVPPRADVTPATTSGFAGIGTLNAPEPKKKDPKRGSSRRQVVDGKDDRRMKVSREKSKDRDKTRGK